MINGKKYVGQTTTSLSNRKNGHIKSAEKGKGHTFQHAIRKYGKENFKWDVLYSGSCLNRMECYYIALLQTLVNQNGYNIARGGKFWNVWYSETEETRKEHTQKISNTKKKNGDSIGEKNGMYGNGYKLEGGKNGRARQVMCPETGEVFLCIEDLAKSLNIVGPKTSVWRKVKALLNNKEYVNFKHYEYYITKEKVPFLDKERLMITKNLRPRKLSEIAGNEATVRTFKKYCSSLEFVIPDVLLLVGASGSGKSTSAFILGMTINCQDPIYDENEKTYNPCLICPHCKSVMNETFSKDFLFLNGAAMGPDDILDLEEQASYSPMYGGRKKIICIDEAQELSKKSKSSLLLLLEKKRKDCIFILCSMDKSSIDKAVLSRCQIFEFKPLAASVIGNYLCNILDTLDPEKKINISLEAIALLSENSYGSMRQAEQYLERCIDSELYTVEQIESEFSFLSEVKGYEIFQQLINKDQDFFESLKTIKAEDFYIYSWAILGSLNKATLTLERDDWKYKSSIAILQNPNYESLSQAYLNINRDTQGWFKDHIFQYYIGKYMSENAPPRVRQRREI